MGRSDALLAPPSGRVARWARGDEGDGTAPPRHVRSVGSSRDLRGRIRLRRTRPTPRRRALPRARARGRALLRAAAGTAHQRGAHLLRFARAHRLGAGLSGAYAAGPPGDAADGARSLPGPELRERRLSRGNVPMVPRRRRATVALSMARGPRRARPGRQRGGPLLPRWSVRSGLPPRRRAGVPRVPERQVPSEPAVA